MKRGSRTSSRRAKPEPTPDQIRRHIQALCREHEEKWYEELHSPAPHWVYLLGLHLRIVELANLEPAAKELL